MLEQDVVLSHAFAKEEVERFTYRAPGAGQQLLLWIFAAAGAAQGDAKRRSEPKFDQKKFHDFILAQGLLPPDLMRKAVLEDFVPSQK